MGLAELLITPEKFVAIYSFILLVLSSARVKKMMTRNYPAELNLK